MLLLGTSRTAVTSWGCPLCSSPSRQVRQGHVTPGGGGAEGGAGGSGAAGEAGGAGAAKGAGGSGGAGASTGKILTPSFLAEPAILSWRQSQPANRLQQKPKLT